MTSSAPNKPHHFEELIKLDRIQSILEEEISNYALVNTENIHEEDEDTILRAFVFERGITDYLILLYPSGHIKSVAKDIPTSLFLDIMNTMMDYAYDEQVD